MGEIIVWLSGLAWLSVGIVMLDQCSSTKPLLWRLAELQRSCFLWQVIQPSSAECQGADGDVTSGDKNV